MDPMNEAEYLADRVDDQIAWFDGKSGINQRRYKRFRTLEIVTAAFVPVLAAFGDVHVAVRLATAIAGALVVIFAGLLSVHRYQEIWVQYRATGEALRRERYRYRTKVPPYDGDRPFPHLVSRVEGILSNEGGTWAEVMKLKPGES